MQEPLFLQPVFQEKIWGGNRLHTLFGFDLPSDKIGEDWAISAHPHGVSTVLNGEFKGKKLDELWADHQELFGHAGGAVFPLLTKILDAEDDLSVQVHPDDAYGQKQKGDFYYVPSGTIHAIGSGILILETQQSSDTTYRVYDYDRTDDQGKTRELHIQQSIDVTTVPAKDPDFSIQQENQGQSSIVTYVKTDFFNVYEWRVSGILKVKKQAPYTLATVIEGVGRLITEDAAKADVATFDLKKGDSFIFPTDIPSWRFEGDLTIIASEPGSR